MFKEKYKANSFYEAEGSNIEREYERMRANIMFASQQNKAKIFTFLSQSRKDGKTNTITCLGIAFSKAGQRVLLIDGNFQNPKLHNLFGLKNETGFSNYLGKQCSIKDCIQQTSISNLSVLPSGTVSKQLETVIHGGEMHSLLNTVRHKFDYVFIDTEAIKESSVSKLFAAESDSAIVVIRNKKTTREEIQEMKSTIKSYNIHVTGAIYSTRRISWMKR